MAIIGRDENNNYVHIGDYERRSGLYVLGKPRMGKSWLLVNLILQDIKEGHGVFFLDPHGDAINEVLEYSTSDTRDMLLLDPSDKHETFGINPLFCSDISDIQKRDRAFNKTKGIFDRLWKETFEDKPWLQMILQNTILAFIENPGLTLIELPIFFRNTDFRDYVVSNIRYNWQVRDYWNLTFNSKSKRLQEEQLVAAETRAHNMLTIPFVSDIVGQSRSTIDFERLIEEKKIILVNLSTQLSYEARKIIGTILISELLHAIEQRPSNKRHQFCIYVDEFHNFAAYQDFSTLITDAPKFGVATTLAHHERAGQLSGHPRMMGATAAIANKILFQITGRDAEELSREFAQEPEKEIRYEDKYIISREPVWDLLRWHDNQKIREFVIKYIRPLKERLEDIKGEQEAERLIRSEFIEEASLYRISDILEGAGRFSNINPGRESLSSAGRMIAHASAQTRQLMTLSQEATHIAHTFRSLNKLFCSVMDGTLDIRSGEFTNYLVTGITAMAGLTSVQRKAIAFYITVRTAERYILKVPFDIAKEYGLFPQQVEANQKEVDDEWQNRQNEYMEKYRKCWWFDWNKLTYVDPKKPPEDIRDGIGQREIDQTMAVIWYRNKDVIQKLEEFVEVCRLLCMPENCIIKKSGQHTAKQINVRTEQDMVNEMARKLTELPHYTAYGKLLRSCKGKIRTLPLEELHKPYRILVYIDRGFKIRHSQLIRNNSWMFAKERVKIEEEIRERHERLAGGHDEEPPAVGAPAWPRLVARWPEDILSRRVSRPADVSEDEPPPSRS